MKFAALPDDALCVGEEIDSEMSAKRICLLITSLDADIAKLRHSLGDTLDVEIARWQEGNYLEAIQTLHPAVIVTEAETVDLASDFAALIAALITDYYPTVVGIALSPSTHYAACFEVRQLGGGALARVSSLADLTFW